MNGRQRIYSQKDKGLNEQERLDIARLLIKAGYTVKIGKERSAGKSNAAYIYFVEYWKDGME